jgi:3-dehydroquinate dehydratase-2
MDPTIFILNGPNLNRLGKREPQIYGHETLDTVKNRCREKGAALGFEIDFRQTNFEGVLIESIHEAVDRPAAGIIINPAGLTFTSVALMDALKMFDGPKVELHISNVHKREPVYHESLVSAPVTAVMAGFGTHGYLLALDWMRIQIAPTVGRVGDQK